MPQNDFTANKLLLLFLIREKDAISRSDLSDFVIFHQYMDYFTMDQCLAELEKTELIVSSEADMKLFYRITGRGLETLELFELRIPYSQRREMSEFAGLGGIDRSSTLGTEAEVEENADGSGTLICRVRDYDSEAFTLTIRADSPEEAAKLRQAWLERGLRLFRQLMSGLREEDRTDLL